MSNKSEEDLWDALDTFLGRGSVFAIILLTFFYFLINELKPKQGGFWEAIRTFSLSIIVNLIPVFILFAGSYYLLRRIQSLRSEQESDELASKVAERLVEELRKAGIALQYDLIPEDAQVTAEKASTSDEHALLLDRIEFDYPTYSKLPRWKIRKPPDVATPDFEDGSDGHFGKALRINSTAQCAMDFFVTDRASVGSCVHFAAKLEANTHFYANINVQSSDSSKSEPRWLNFTVGGGKPSLVNPTEWAIPIRPSSRCGDWSIFKIDLNDAVEQTFGKDGWKLRELLGFRFRGSLALAYISIYRSQ